MGSSNETKKCRIWNPALDDCYGIIKSEKAESSVPISVQYESKFQNYVRIMHPCVTDAAHPEYSSIVQCNTSAIRFQSEFTPLSNFPMTALMSSNFTSVLNQNCCAVCGCVFRLTTDLVQHMRVNHRTSHPRTQKRSAQ